MLAKRGILAALAGLAALGPGLAADRIADTNYYAAYYDGKIGPVADGYWGHHGKYFWYQDRSGQWHRDDGTHFQHDAAAGFTLFHGSGVSRQH